jgi:hypothetical protein
MTAGPCVTNSFLPRSPFAAEEGSQFLPAASQLGPAGSRWRGLFVLEGLLMQPVFGYPSSPQRIRLDEVGEGVRTGPEPGRDNAGILEDAFKLARPGDTLIGAVDHDGDPSWLPQCTVTAY